MIEVKKKSGEPLESMLRRFKKKLLQSGTIFRARALRFYEPSRNKRATRDSAIRRSRIKAEKELAKKLGKDSMDMPGSRKR